MQILETVFFGKYHFEVAMVLRSSLFLSSILLNSEAWVNLTDQNIRSLEQSDEMLLSKILNSEANTSNAFKYLELGIYPLRFEIMKRKILYLQYILKQNKASMMYQVLKATMDNPLRNDFVQTCVKYLNDLKIDLSFDQIEKMSVWTFKKMVKERISEAGFSYLKEKVSKQNISHIKYDNLEIQEYLLDGNQNIKVAKLIFKARSMTLDLKMQKKWRYQDTTCIGCGVKDETGEEILSCSGYSDSKDDYGEQPAMYSNFYYGTTSEMVKLAKRVMKRLKEREKMKESMPD